MVKFLLKWTFDLITIMFHSRWTIHSVEYWFIKKYIQAFVVSTILSWPKITTTLFRLPFITVRSYERLGVSNHWQLDCLSNKFSGLQQRKHQSSTLLDFVREIPRVTNLLPTQNPQCGKRFHFMTSSWRYPVVAVRYMRIFVRCNYLSMSQILLLPHRTEAYFVNCSQWNSIKIMSDFNSDYNDPFYELGWTLIPAWISNIPNKGWDEITYPFPNFDGCNVDICEFISNFAPHV